MLGPVVFAASLVQASAPVDFEREVRPILAASCFACHGPEKDKAELRLDVRERALAGAYAGTAPVIVPGKSGESSLYLRLVTANDDERMPQKAPRLPAEQIEALRRWIDEGARWPDEMAGSTAKGAGHWAYSPPARPPLPTVRDAAWVREPFDAFVLAALERDGLRPAPEADRATLLRRLSLDLTGLPPSVAELDAFERDTRPQAYQDEVRRLLASPHFGERMARPWLDLARYADTHGYEKDARRSQWPYRDWVVDAFNDNVPFDRFSVLQLAGDLVEGASTRERLATGFHRNTMLNEEGGVDDEEFRADAVIDRVNTTATVWLGSTLACAQCHDHKYDPFSQREYFQLFAVFNSTADGGRANEPTVPALDDAALARVRELDARVAQLEQRLTEPEAQLDAAQTKWEREALAAMAHREPWRTLRPASVHLTSGRAHEVLDDDSVLVRDVAPATEMFELVFEPGELEFDVLRLEALRDATLPAGGPGASDGGNFVLSTIEAVVLGADGSQRRVPFSSAEATHEQSRANYRAAHSIDPSPQTGWAIGGAGRDSELSAQFFSAQTVRLGSSDRLHVILTHASSFERHALGRMRISARRDAPARAAESGLKLTPWRSIGPIVCSSKEQALALVPAARIEHLEGRAHAEEQPGGMRWLERGEWVDRVPHRIDGEGHVWVLERRITVAQPRKLEIFVGADDAFRLWLEGELVASSEDYTTLTDEPVRVEVALAAGENRLLLEFVNFQGAGGFVFDTGSQTSDRRPVQVDDALAASPRTADQARRLRDYFRRTVSDVGRALAVEADAARAESERLRRDAPTALVLAERGTPRETRIFQRGSFLSPGDVVQPGVPAVLGGLAFGAEPARLAFARWLVSPANPLAARVHVNRLWEWIFGRGLVASSDDFGTRGERPTHPELLDWLALEFIESGWDQKALIERIVLSATYRQSSEVAAAAYEADPSNSALARGARYRLEAEALRDVALEASGLLVKTLGGPSVMPPQPAGVWRSAYSVENWSDAQGADRWRRGLYTFWKRTAPYLTFSLFEAPSRELVCARREPTNTPLQALALLDDPAFVEASLALARRLLREAGSDAARLEHAMRLCTARRPTATEAAALLALLEGSRTAFAADSAAAAARVEGAGRQLEAVNDAVDPVELAAWMSVGTVVLNLDDTISRR